MSTPLKRCLPPGLPAERLLSMFAVMLLARAVDERQWLLNRGGRQSFHISCQGHEAAQVGSAFALAPGTDVLVAYYRSLAACLAFGMTARDVFLAALARADDPSTGGRQMPAHPGPRALNIMTTGSSVGTQIPHAVGAALASKLRGDGALAVVYFGDGATSKGDFHEGLNFAAIHKLPVLFVCENNHLAISLPTCGQMAVASVAERAAGYGLPGVAVDGTDALAVYQVTSEAAARARAGQGPTLIDADVVRLTPHSSDDDDRRYRGDGDREEARRRDPIPRLRDDLRAHGLLDDAAERAVRAQVLRTVEDALAYAEAASPAAAGSALDHVYAHGRPQDVKMGLRAAW